MQSILDREFTPDERVDLEDLHTEVLRQFHQFRKTKQSGFPEWATDRQKRLAYINKWMYIHDVFATWVTQVDQNTMVGSKINDKINQVRLDGEEHNWDLTKHLNENDKPDKKPPQRTLSQVGLTRD